MEITWLSVIYWVLGTQMWHIISTDSSEQAPSFTRQPTSQVVPLNSEVVLHCQILPSGTNILWMYNGQYITENANNGIHIEGGVLRIASLGHKTKSDEEGEGDEDHNNHEGVYQCVGNNSVGLIVSVEARVEAAYIGEFPPDVEDSVLSITEGNVALISCPSIESVPPRNTVFEIDGQTITSDYDSSRHHVLPSGNLQIGDVKQSDQGFYQCISINPVTKEKRMAPNEVELRVRAPTTDKEVHVVHKLDDNYYVLRGQSITLECVVNGAPVPVIMWEKYGGHLPEGRYEQVLGNLVLKKVQTEDAGTYVCRGSNGNNQPKVSHGHLHVIEPAQIRRGPVDKDTVMGETVVFECTTRGSDSVMKQWMFNGYQVFSNNYISITDTTLQITNVQKHHAGMYQCTVRNKFGMTQAYARLRVREEGDVMPVMEVVKEVDLTKLQDPAPDGDGDSNADPTPVDSFFPDPDELDPVPTRGRKGKDRTGRPGRRQKNSRNRQLPRDGELLGMEDGRDPDDGDVRGGATRNKKNERKNREQIMIPPSMPAVSKLSDTAVKLEWSVPDGENGLPITFFKIQYKELDNPRNKRWITIDADIEEHLRIHEVSGLKPGATYRFRIVAVYSNNDNKQGPNSKRFTLEMAPENRPKPPLSAPQIVEARSSSTASIVIAWQYLPVDQSPIEGFFVYFKPYGSKRDYSKHTILGANEDRYKIPALHPSTEYSIRMQSFNTAGESEISNTVVKKTLAYTDNPEDYDPLGHPDDWETLLSPIVTTTTEKYPSDVFLNNPNSTQDSNEKLYMILGIVLGLMMLLLIVFMVMCAWKQRQQRRLMAAIAGRNKFSDPSKAIYTDTSLHKKPNGNGHFLLNGLNGGVRNGGVGNGHVVTYNPHASNGGSRVNINVNPFQQEHEGKQGNSLQELRSSLQEMLQSPPPPPCSDPNCNSICRRSHYNQDGGSQLEPHLEHSECNSCCDNEDCQSPGSDCHPYQPPPEYHSLLRQPPPVTISNHHSSHSIKSSGSGHNMSSFKPQRRGLAHQNDSLQNDSPNRCMSPDHIPRSHERLPHRSLEHRRELNEGDSGNGRLNSGSPFVPNQRHHHDTSTPLPAPPPVPPHAGHYDITPPRHGAGRFNAPKLPSASGYYHEIDSQRGGEYYAHHDDPTHKDYDEDVSPTADHYEQLPQDRCQPADVDSQHSQGSSSQGRQHKRRRKRRESSPQEGSERQDQGTNTDYSSNDGTLDSHLQESPAGSPPYSQQSSSATSPPLPHTPTPPVRTHSKHSHNASLPDHNVPAAKRDYSDPNVPMLINDYSQRNNRYPEAPHLNGYLDNSIDSDRYDELPESYIGDSEEAACPMIPRANDYPASDQDELDD